ncbi:YicC/YloC family endoribonuclease [Limisphaera sp. VF-2]|uniref:YicC/YloC family endoribonuclease n=1 Tax=Limisphaera sp. VF-2 TaxID=3400418 RepID=UPI0030ABD085
MKSMTGHGRGVCQRNGLRVTVELTSVNRKQAEINLLLPRELDVLEGPMRDLISRQIDRGRVQGRVSVEILSPQWARPRLNAALAEGWARELQRLARKLGLAETVTLEHLLRIPGLFQSDEPLVPWEKLWPVVQAALQQALDRLVRMRQREGEFLARDLSRRIERMRRAVARIRARAPRALERYRKQLLQRIRAAGLTQTPESDERLLKEVILFADRSDITEELTRLESHFRQFDACRRSRAPVGRTLDFLAQEMYREINTLGTKANDARISQEVVRLKTELERFREQVQNVE